MRSAAVPLVCLALVACGGSGDDAGDGGSAAPRPEGASLTVTVRPEEGAPVTTRRRVECERLGEGSAVCRRLAGLTAKRLAPVPPETACTQIYGGPVQARVRGDLRGTRIDERFSRENGCEIERWERNRALLGRAPRGPQP